jgi:uncharacterized membrane protein
MNSLNEPRSISLLKSISYRMFGTLTTFVGCYVFTGKVVLSVGVGIFDFFAKLVLFYLHERAWVHVPEMVHKLNRAVRRIEKSEKS